jgi:hypothetical protein
MPKLEHKTPEVTQIPEISSRKEIDTMAPNSKNDRPSSPHSAESDQTLRSFSIVALAAASVRSPTVSRNVLGKDLRRRQSGTSNWSTERPDLVLLFEEALAIGDDCSQFDDNDKLDEYPSHV